MKFVTVLTIGDYIGLCLVVVALAFMGYGWVDYKFKEWRKRKALGK